MAINSGRAIVFRPTTSLRSFCTAVIEPVAVEPDSTVRKRSESNDMFHRLLNTGSSNSDIIVSAILDEWSGRRESVTRIDLVDYIRGLRNMNKCQIALEVLEWMGKKKIEFNNADQAVRINLIARTTGVSSAEKFFNKLHKSSKTKKTYGALLSCYRNEKSLDKAVNLFEEMKSNNCTSTLSYNNLMSLYLSTGHPEKVILLAEEMEENNIDMDLYTYNHLISGYKLLEDLDSVDRVLKKMEEKKIKLDWITYGNIANIYLKFDLIEKAKYTVEKMEEIPNLRDRVAFNTIIGLYGRMSDLTGVNRVWESLKSACPKPSNISYFVMLLALSKLGDIQRLEEIFREWESESLRYDARVANVMMESYLDRGMFDEANAIYEKILKNEAEPNSKTYALFTNYLAKKSDFDLSLRFLEMGVKHMKPGKPVWFPTDETVTMFLTYFKENEDVEKAEKFCEILKNTGRLDDSVYDSIHRTNIASGKVESQE